MSSAKAPSMSRGCISSSASAAAPPSAPSRSRSSTRACARTSSPSARPLREWTAMTDNTETAILAGGCFWGVQELLRRRDGVISTRVGYAGGENENPTYGSHPGPAEAAEVVVAPARTSYRDILEFFFQIHDPTTKDRQGNDIGSDYRSEIFYTSDLALLVARVEDLDVDASGLWPG